MSIDISTFDAGGWIGRGQVLALPSRCGEVRPLLSSSARDYAYSFLDQEGLHTLLICISSDQWSVYAD